MTLASVLTAGCDELGLTLDATQQGALVTYVDELDKWNRAYNLTAVRDPLAMMTRHVLDSLAVLPFLSEQAVLDVGTGPGIPGIMLAIMRPSQPFVLLDANGKKTRFVQHARRLLGLNNVTVVQGRVEQQTAPAAQVISRAFASLPDMMRLLEPVVTAQTRVLAMKAATTDEEMAQLSERWSATRHDIQVPGLNEPRTLVVVQRAG